MSRAGPFDPMAPHPARHAKELCIRHVLIDGQGPDHPIPVMSFAVKGKDRKSSAIAQTQHPVSAVLNVDDRIEIKARRQHGSQRPFVLFQVDVGRVIGPPRTALIGPCQPPTPPRVGPAIAPKQSPTRRRRSGKVKCWARLKQAKTCDVTEAMRDLRIDKGVVGRANRYYSSSALEGSMPICSHIRAA